jgi:hypothetical protein
MGEPSADASDAASTTFYAVKTFTRKVLGRAVSRMASDLHHGFRRRANLLVTWRGWYATCGSPGRLCRGANGRHRAVVAMEDGMMDLALLLLRVITGGLLAGHGAQKLFGWFEGHGIQGRPAGWSPWV